jgi:hypothetical protein
MNVKKRLVFAFAAGATVAFSAILLVLNAVFDPNDTSFDNPNP